MQRRNRHILYIEDDENDVRLLQRAFRAERMKETLHVVPDGTAGLAWLGGQGAYADRDKHPLPGLVLLDVQLPDMNGVEVLQWIRHQPTLRSLPVIALSGSYRDSDIGPAFQLGLSAFLDKPASPSNLRQIVRFLRTWLDYAVPPPPGPDRAMRRWQSAVMRPPTQITPSRFPLHEPEGSECWRTEA